jgi:hypothetical protein
MPLRAIAFHENISVENLEKLFKAEWNQLFANTTFAHCKGCKRLYAVFLADGNDKNNGDYVAELEKRISDDCNGGKHSMVEIRFVA